MIYCKRSLDNTFHGYGFEINDEDNNDGTVNVENTDPIQDIDAYDDNITPVMEIEDDSALLVEPVSYEGGALANEEPVLFYNEILESIPVIPVENCHGAICENIPVEIAGTDNGFVAAEKKAQDDEGEALFVPAEDIVPVKSQQEGGSIYAKGYALKLHGGSIRALGYQTGDGEYYTIEGGSLKSIFKKIANKVKGVGKKVLNKAGDVTKNLAKKVADTGKVALNAVGNAAQKFVESGAIEKAVGQLGSVMDQKARNVTTNLVGKILTGKGLGGAILSNQFDDFYDRYGGSIVAYGFNGGMLSEDAANRDPHNGYMHGSGNDVDNNEVDPNDINSVIKDIAIKVKNKHIAREAAIKKIALLISGKQPGITQQKANEAARQALNQALFDLEPSSSSSSTGTTDTTLTEKVGDFITSGTGQEVVSALLEPLKLAYRYFVYFVNSDKAAEVMEKVGTYGKLYGKPIAIGTLALGGAATTTYLFSGRSNASTDLVNTSIEAMKYYPGTNVRVLTEGTRRWDNADVLFQQAHIELQNCYSNSDSIWRKRSPEEKMEVCDEYFQTIKNFKTLEEVAKKAEIRAEKEIADSAVTGELPKTAEMLAKKKPLLIEDATLIQKTAAIFIDPEMIDNVAAAGKLLKSKFMNWMGYEEKKKVTFVPDGKGYGRRRRYKRGYGFSGGDLPSSTRSRYSKARKWLQGISNVTIDKVRERITSARQRWSSRYLINPANNRGNEDGFFDIINFAAIGEWISTYGIGIGTCTQLITHGISCIASLITGGGSLALLFGATGALAGIWLAIFLWNHYHQIHIPANENEYRLLIENLDQLQEIKVQIAKINEILVEVMEEDPVLSQLQVQQAAETVMPQLEQIAINLNSIISCVNVLTEADKPLTEALQESQLRLNDDANIRRIRESRYKIERLLKGNKPKSSTRVGKFTNSSVHNHTPILKTIGYRDKEDIQDLIDELAEQDEKIEEEEEREHDEIQNYIENQPILGLVIDNDGNEYMEEIETEGVKKLSDQSIRIPTKDGFKDIKFKDIVDLSTKYDATISDIIEKFRKPTEEFKQKNPVLAAEIEKISKEAQQKQEQKTPLVGHKYDTRNNPRNKTKGGQINPLDIPMNPAYDYDYDDIEITPSRNPLDIPMNPAYDYDYDDGIEITPSRNPLDIPMNPAYDYDYDDIEITPFTRQRNPLDIPMNPAYDYDYDDDDIEIIPPRNNLTYDSSGRVLPYSIRKQINPLDIPMRSRYKNGGSLYNDAPPRLLAFPTTVSRRTMQVVPRREILGYLRQRSSLNGNYSSPEYIAYRRGEFDAVMADRIKEVLKNKPRLYSMFKEQIRGKGFAVNGIQYDGYYRPMYGSSLSYNYPYDAIDIMKRKRKYPPRPIRGNGLITNLFKKATKTIKNKVIPTVKNKVLPAAKQLAKKIV